MSQVAEGRLGKRLRRILLLLPYAIKHPGVTVDELAKKFGVEQGDLLDDLNLVFLCGLPGYGPGDLIDVTIDDEDRVFIRMADYFSEPFRLTPAEALALYTSGKALTELPGMEEAEALKAALDKVGRALGMDDEQGAPTIEVHLEKGAEEHLETIQRAIGENRRVHLHYRSASAGELSERDVDPWGLVAAQGRWYLIGLDHRSGEERMFRLDRVKSAVELDATSVVPEDFDPADYKGAWTGGGEFRMIMEISPAAAVWFPDYYTTATVSALPDGWANVTLPASSETWGATLVVKLGPHVRKVQPAGVAVAARAMAERITGLHGD